MPSSLNLERQFIQLEIKDRTGEFINNRGNPKVVAGESEIIFLMIRYLSQWILVGVLYLNYLCQKPYPRTYKLARDMCF